MSAPDNHETDYYPMVDETGGVLSPVTHADDSERIHFDDDALAEHLLQPSHPSTPSHRSLPSNRQARLNGLNYLNVVTYACHLFASWGIGVFGLGGLVDTRWEIQRRHATLVTPAHWSSLLIWAPILIMEAIFTIAQLFPYYRSRPIVQAGTRYWFFYATVLQTAWTLFFSFKLFLFSFISVVLTLIALVALLLSQYHHSVRGEQGRRKTMEYILFRCPFFLHTGWMILICADHFSMLLQFYGGSVGLQVGADIFCIAILLATATACLTTPPYTDFGIPLMLLWAYFGILSNLHNPNETLLDIYGDTIIQALRNATYMCMTGLLALLMPNMVVWVAREFCTIRVVDID